MSPPEVYATNDQLEQYKRWAHYLFQRLREVDVSDMSDGGGNEGGGSVRVAVSLREVGAVLSSRNILVTGVRRHCLAASEVDAEKVSLEVRNEEASGEDQVDSVEASGSTTTSRKRSGDDLQRLPDGSNWDLSAALSNVFEVTLCRYQRKEEHSSWR